MRFGLYSCIQAYTNAFGLYTYGFAFSRSFWPLHIRFSLSLVRLGLAHAFFTLTCAFGPCTCVLTSYDSGLYTYVLTFAFLRLSIYDFVFNLFSSNPKSEPKHVMAGQCDSVGVKKSPNFSKSNPKGRCSSTYTRVRFFKIAQKVANHLGYFCGFFVSLKFKKSPNLVTLLLGDTIEGKHHHRITVLISVAKIEQLFLSCQILSRQCRERLYFI